MAVCLSALRLLFELCRLRAAASSAQVSPLHSTSTFDLPGFVVEHFHQVVCQIQGVNPHTHTNTWQPCCPSGCQQRATSLFFNLTAPTMNVYVCGLCAISQTGPCYVCRGRSHTHDSPCVDCGGICSPYVFLRPFYSRVCRPSVHFHQRATRWEPEQISLPSLLQNNHFLPQASDGLFTHLSICSNERLLLLIQALMVCSKVQHLPPSLTCHYKFCTFLFSLLPFICEWV